MFALPFLLFSFLLALVAVVVSLRLKGKMGIALFLISIIVIVLLGVDLLNLYRLQYRRRALSQHIRQGMSADEVVSLISANMEPWNISEWNDSENFIAIGLKGPFSLIALLTHGEALSILTAKKDPVTNRLITPLNGNSSEANGGRMKAEESKSPDASIKSGGSVEIWKNPVDDTTQEPEPDAVDGTEEEKTIN